MPTTAQIISVVVQGILLGGAPGPLPDPPDENPLTYGSEQLTIGSEELSYGHE